MHYSKMGRSNAMDHLKTMGCSEAMGRSKAMCHSKMGRLKAMGHTKAMGRSKVIDHQQTTGQGKYGKRLNIQEWRA